MGCRGEVDSSWGGSLPARFTMEDTIGKRGVSLSEEESWVTVRRLVPAPWHTDAWGDEESP